MPSETEKMTVLDDLAAEIDRQPVWWRFPVEGDVRGFLGSDPLFIVGDQPSTNPWNDRDRGRRAFYDGLRHLGLMNTHLTDLYKLRGRSGGLKGTLPPDFSSHVAFFRRELGLLNPTRVVAIGDLAFTLLSKHVPETRPSLAKMKHFAYFVRRNEPELYADHMRSILLPYAPPKADTHRAHSPTTVLMDSECSDAASSLCARVHSPPVGAHIREWTLRRDNHAHFHRNISAAESPLYLDLSWREDSASDKIHVGVFRLDLGGLLAAGFIRPDPIGSTGAQVRLRVILRDNGRFYLQTRNSGPRLPLL